MTLKQALSQARTVLEANNIEEAPLEAELLLRHTLGISRVQLYLDIDSELSLEQAESFWCLIGRRLKGEPSAYITGHREFCGLDFLVGPAVLIPRPESELLVEAAIKLAQSRMIATIADIGTGCGAIAVSLALALPTARIYATDISGPALEVARSNCQRHGVADKIRLLQGDMLGPLPGPVDLIIANLPYVSQPELARTGLANFEPMLALDGGGDGLEKIYRLCQQAGSRLCPGGSLLLEVGQGQAAAVTAFLRRLFPTARTGVTADLAGIARVVGLHLTLSTLAAKLDGAMRN